MTDKSPSTETAVAILESGFSLEWSMRDGYGATVQIAMRGARPSDWADVLRKRKEFMDGAMKSGWAILPAATIAPPQPQTSTPITNGEGGRGRAACAMIEVATSYTGGKTQLKFHCDGFEHPLTFTKEIGAMVKLLAPLGIGADKIVVGKKIPVNALVDWQKRDKYTDVVSVALGEKF